MSTSESTEQGRPIRCEEVVPTLAVGDVEPAIQWYVDVLGFAESWRWGDPPVHAGMLLDRVEVHLSATAPAPGGGWLYFVVDEVDDLHERYTAAGAEIERAPEDQPWGMRELAIRDHVGNALVFGAPCIVREPKLPIEREAVPIRMESRMLAVLRDLADHKGLSLDELLEETVLHTFEPWGDGVASPHTAADIEHIQDLKDAHGIGYDVHASYRFVERDPDAVSDEA